MGPLDRATLAACLMLAVASLAPDPALAGEDDGHYPVGVAERNGPVWERPRSTQFQVMRCSADAQIVDRLTLNRDSAAQTKGAATYNDAARGEGAKEGAGDWALVGNRLSVSGDGFELVGDWSGAMLTATITRAGGQPARCRFQVNALRSFTQYQ